MIAKTIVFKKAAYGPKKKSIVQAGPAILI